MSKASEYADRRKAIESEMHALSESAAKVMPVLIVNGVPVANVTVSIDGEPRCYIGHVERGHLPAEALALADWIQATFGEPDAS